jgi:nicotinic acid phosphoribosyltransferase
MTTDEALTHAILTIKLDVGMKDKDDDSAIAVLEELRTIMSACRNLRLTKDELQALRQLANDDPLGVRWHTIVPLAKKLLTLYRVAAV